MEPLLNRLAVPRHALVLSLILSALLLAGAHAFERLGGLAPCLLCLDQREVHWTALAVTGLLLGLAAAGAGRLVAAGLGALTLIYLFSFGLASYHAGVEWGFWPGPAGCAAAPPGQAPATTDLIASLDAPGPAGPSCVEAPWRLFGISMAGYNALVSLLLAGLTGYACALFARRMDGERQSA